MEKIMLVKRKEACIILLGIFILPICLAYNNPILSTMIAMIFWGISIVFSLKNIRCRFALLSYNIGFFVFILGGYTISYFKSGTFEYFSNTYFRSSSMAVNHACTCVMLCMIVVNCSYMIFNKETDSKKERKLPYNANVPLIVKQIFIVVIVFSFACQLLVAIENLILVKTVTYYASDNYLSILPSVLTYISSLYFITLFMYWATFPTKRGVWISGLSLVVLEIIVLMSGERGEPISIFLVLIFYIFLRQKYGFNDVVISKKVLAIMVILIPFIMYGLQAISYTRDNNDYEASVSNGVSDFIESQGGSVKIIANSYDLNEKIEQLVDGKHTFVLGEIRYYLKNNVFTRLITGKKTSLRTIDDAFSGDNYLRTYGYAYAPTTYKNGVGSGSTYIAEVYYDGGYILLIFINVLVGFLIAKLDRTKCKTIIGMAIMMNIFRYISLLPRGMALDWLTNTFAVQNIIIFLGIYLLINRFQKKNQKMIMQNKDNIRLRSDGR